MGMRDLWDAVEWTEEVAVASVVSSDDSNCRVEAVAKAHISELTLEAKDVETCSSLSGCTTT